MLDSDAHRHAASEEREEGPGAARRQPCGAMLSKAALVCIFAMARVPAVRSGCWKVRLISASPALHVQLHPADPAPASPPLSRA